MKAKNVPTNAFNNIPNNIFRERRVGGVGAVDITTVMLLLATIESIYICILHRIKKSEQNNMEEQGCLESIVLYLQL
jgi:hypothetical protein